MAKAKKGKLTIEDALVPVEEQPYEIPENWCWTTLDMVADYKKGPFGSSITKAMFVPKGDNTYKVYEQGNAIRKTVQYGEYYITKEKFEELRGFEVHPGDLIVSCAGTIGETYQLPEIIEEGVINQALMRVKVSEKVDLKYYLYYFDEMLRQDITGNSKGSAIKNIPPFTVLKKFPYPLPPLAEQKRIVEQIENLFSKLEEAKEKAQESLDGFQTRIDSILRKAFSGDLSAVWRNEKGVSSARESVVFKDILDVRDGTHDSPQYYDEGYPLVTSKNLKNGCITNKDIKYISKEDFDQINQRSKVDVGDILFAMIGTIGNPVVIEDEPNYAIKNVALFKNKGKVNPYFIKYYLESREVRDKMQKEAKGTTQKFVSLGYLRDFPIVIPSGLEQEYIVKELDELLSKEFQAVSIIEEVIDQIDLMKKSILAKAFRGELGTNNPDEESSIELLKSVIEA